MREVQLPAFSEKRTISSSTKTSQRRNPIRSCPDDQNAEVAVAVVEAEGDAVVVAVSVSVFGQAFCPVWLEASPLVSVSFLHGSDDANVISSNFKRKLNVCTLRSCYWYSESHLM